MDTIANRITYAREAKKLGIQQLADALGVSYQGVRQWELGMTEPRGKRLDAIAAALGVSRLWLQTGIHQAAADNPLGAGNITTRPRPIKVWEEGEALEHGEVEVKRLSLRMAAGVGRLQWEVDEEGTPNRFRLGWCHRNNLKPEKLATILVEGDSMQPTIPDSARLTINTDISEMRNGRLHAIDYHGEFYIKRLFREPDGSIRIVSDNADKVRFQDVIVPKEHATALRILGVPVDMSVNLIGM
ncbi:helix-turn-helix domain-containing protein [Chitinimonas arctica]|uniref:Helix-turn-helix domain-containing protein n=1 Tax=Chitinimonas arctica TaxID=2594795 RepID=A0A516SAZ0_9NEIS|nr:S24 family peptidase [Chitinimonas arctica]QDQ25313.1 helix-turn-helix domain-containing protein [Chitinimonas arctica]